MCRGKEVRSIHTFTLFVSFMETRQRFPLYFGLVLAGVQDSQNPSNVTEYQPHQIFTS
jgi:hypothetical protein